MVISEYENRSLTAEETMTEVQLFQSWINVINLKYFIDAFWQVDILASGLLQCGLKPNDRLGICSSNSYKAYITTLAAARIGVIVVSKCILYNVIFTINKNYIYI